MSITYSRRHALWLSAGLIVACRDARNGADAAPPIAALPTNAGPPMPYGPGPAREASGGATSTDAATPTCIETHDNIEGPYYRPGAPERANLVEDGMPGTPIDLEGRVMGQGCGQGLAGVELDVWHATHDGHYDNDGTMKVAAARYLLRGRLRTDAEGRYRVRTIIPGRYLNGPQYRPAHVHVKVRAKGFAPLTTQLYFPDDPYNDVDPFIHRSLIIGMEKARAGRLGHFDFVLRQV
jgi:protocatechuate 3,4-dioxygenase beta subunit